MTNKEKARLTYDALQKRKIEREKKKEREINGAMCFLVQGSMRGKIINSVNSSGKRFR
jgi:hypothetical protein